MELSNNNDNSLKVLTLNCWGLKFISSQRKERIKAIGNWLINEAKINSTNSNSNNRNSYNSEQSSNSINNNNNNDYKIICLQEIWVKSDFDSIVLKAKSIGINYSKFFYSGAIGSGLAILSSYPILDSFIHPFKLCGHPLNVIEGDFYAAKSVCGITISIPNLGKVEVLNTHLYAPGGEGESIEGSHRIAQVWELSKIVREKSERGRHVILMGDLNSQPHSLIIRLLLSYGLLHDAWSQIHPIPPSIHSSAHKSLTPIEKLKIHGITCDSPLNSYSAPKLIKKSKDDEIIMRGGKRLDYILFCDPSSSSSTSSSTSPSLIDSTSEQSLNLAPLSTSLVLTSLVPSTSYSYSDHFGLTCSFSFSPSSLPAPPSLSSTDLLQSLSLLNSSLTHSLSQSRHQLNLFFLSLLLIPVLGITASYQPLKYLNWIWVLLGVMVGGTGIVMFLSGFVGGRWEEGGLRNLVGEMEDWRERLSDE